MIKVGGFDGLIIAKILPKRAFWILNRSGGELDENIFLFFVFTTLCSLPKNSTLVCERTCHFVASHNAFVFVRVENLRL